MKECGLADPDFAALEGAPLAASVSRRKKEHMMIMGDDNDEDDDDDADDKR